MTTATLTSRTCEECSFESFDGTKLFYRYWPAPDQATARAVLLFHRGHEHGGRMAHLVDELGLDDYAFFAWDARGLGRSPGQRGYAENVGVLVKDVDAFARHICSRYGLSMSDLAVVAQSVGAVLVSAWVHDYAPPIRCMVLASPAFKVKLYVPFARQALLLMQRFRPRFFVNSYVRPGFLTHDRQRAASYATDPLITPAIAVGILLGLYDTAQRVVADAETITVPTQLLISGADWVVHRAPQQAFFARLGSSIKESHVLEGFFHDTLGEKDRAPALARVRAFLVQRFAAAPVSVRLRDADRRGVTRAEFDRLSRPPVSVVARIYWAASRLGIRLGGMLSNGIRLGLDTGFDSGSTLDYVYRNVPAGVTPLGRLIDRVYLDSIGWRGIRVRKMHVERLIGIALGTLQAAARPVRVTDIAAGHGRYVFDALRRSSVVPDHVLLRDYSAPNVEAGRRLIEERGLQAIARFVEGDAFDGASLAAMTPRPTLAVVSGLYELFPDNALIRRSLAGLSAAIEDGGYLVTTCQPWHPQLEMIARTLASHRQGSPWIMRRRTQAEMDQLLAEAGFEKLDQYADPWGIFTVSLSRKCASAKS